MLKVNQNRIQNIKQDITMLCFSLGNLHPIVRMDHEFGSLVMTKLMQEWLEGWLKKNNVAFLPNPNTQMPPDVFLDPDNQTEMLLEVKAFNYHATPGFDIADFRAYQNEILAKPYMLHVKYLIFGYVMGEDGYVSIKNLWLKNVWEITRPMARWALNLQVKEGVVHKIRPAKFYTPPRNFATFRTIEDYLSAIEECVFQNPETHKNAAHWRSDMINSYKKHYGVTLGIPRWNDIKDKYIL